MSDRLLVIESFVDDPPDSDFQRGYLCALMDEAVEDIDEAGSDIFDRALRMFRSNDVLHTNWFTRRAKTIG